MNRDNQTLCKNCPAYNPAGQKMEYLGTAYEDSNYRIALAGNPNTGKSSVFNNLTGLHQHTGNWPGKTVTRAKGAFRYNHCKYEITDLPGTYSLLSTSEDEEVARDYILFDKPDVTVIVVDATRLERNLNLVLQILEITDKAVLCLNLMDEAVRNGIRIDIRALSRRLGIPVVPASARRREGMGALLEAIEEVVTGTFQCRRHSIGARPPELQEAIVALRRKLKEFYPDIQSPDWIALRLLEGDRRITDALKNNAWYVQNTSVDGMRNAEEVLELAASLRRNTGRDIHDGIVEAIYKKAAVIAGESVYQGSGDKVYAKDLQIDRIVTSKRWGFPIMFLLLALVFWITIIGANYPSGWLSDILLERFYPLLKEWTVMAGFPSWLTGVLIDGAYLAGAWVIAVMLPPMAIFFPMFTLLEDLGYLPRIAFNLDGIYRKVGAHGKQALSMSMGFGCNAAGVVAARIIDSPRERLIAIITNNFSLCNGRCPTQILIAGIFIGACVPPALDGVITAAAVIFVALLGIALSFGVSWMLSRTVLQGEVSTFSLELPPYRPPRFWQTLYTSLIDRTVFVLWRAVIFALPAGVVIWLVANIRIGGVSLAVHFIDWSDPFAALFGLNGVILLAYIIAIPANEIVIPTILMLTVIHTGITGVGSGTGVMFELDSVPGTAAILYAGGWTLLTGINVMFFSLLHNPCSTTIFTIYKETGSVKWTLVASLLPVIMGLVLTFIVARVWYLCG